MRLSPLTLTLLLLSVLSLGTACGTDEEQNADACDGVVCLAGQDCIDGTCVDREVPDPNLCRSNVDCQYAPGGKLCDAGSGACVQCLRDSHCAAGRRCDAGVCTGSVCTTDADCAAPTSHCNAAGDACVACVEDDDCGSGERCDAGSCAPAPIECSDDEGCAAADPLRPFCVVEGDRGLCVACRDTADCGEGTECVGGSCVTTACTGDGDCSAIPGKAHCSTEGWCVACVTDEHCPEGGTCDAGSCVVPTTCARDADCAGNPAGTICDEASGDCVVCAGDADCALGQRCADRTACEPIGCTDSFDCPAGAHCDDGSCVATGSCTSDEGCALDPRAPHCNAGGVCVACVANEDCAPGESCIDEVCAVPRDCTLDSDCAGGLVCTGGLCKACRSDDQCPRGTCSAGACVNEPTCTSDADCATGVCASGTCAACATSLDCPSGLWCQAGACVTPPSCTATAECGPGSICSGGSCVASTCVDDGSEPDDEAASALPFSMGPPVSRTLCPNDEDWFVFTGATGSGLRAELVAPPAGAKLSLVWFDRATRARHEIEGAGGKLVIRNLAEAATGRYYLRVRSTNGATGGYSLLGSMQVGGGSCPDVLEPNEPRANARALEANRFYDGLTFCGDEDYYLADVPAGGWARAWIFGGGTMQVEIFTVSGSRLGSGQPTSFLGGGKVASTSAPAGAGGQQVLLKVTGGTAPPASYRLFFGTDRDPACGSAPVLIGSGGDRGRFSGTTLGSDPDFAAGACGAGGPDEAWIVEVGAPSRLVAAVRGDFPVVIGLRDAACSGELSCNAAATQATGVLDVPQLAPGSYVISVGGAPQTAGAYELTAQLLAPVAPPGNDACSGAVTIDPVAAPVRVTGSTLGATADGGLSCGPTAPNVHYAFTLLQQARVVVDLAADGNAVLGLADASTCSVEDSCSGAGRTLHLDRVLPAGDYSISVGSASGAEVRFTLDVTLPPAVPGDACGGAVPLTVGSTVSGDTRWARPDLTFPLATSCTGYYLDGPDAFHSVVLTAGQHVTATLTPEATYDAALYVIGDCAAPQCLAGSDVALAGGQETLGFTAPSAGTYRLVVDGASGGGAYSLQLQ